MLPNHVVLALRPLEDYAIANGNEIEIVNVLETAKEIVNVIGKEIEIDHMTSVIVLLWILDGGQESVPQEIWIISHLEDLSGFLLHHPVRQIGKFGVEKIGVGLETGEMTVIATNLHLVDLLLGLQHHPCLIDILPKGQGPLLRLLAAQDQ